MFRGFSQGSFDFLEGIRQNNNKEWFEEHKEDYKKYIAEPLTELEQDIFSPFENTGMVHKICRIYRDPNFPPFLRYRDEMWIDIRYPALYWNKTPAMYFAINPENVSFGFEISKPESAVMEKFRCKISQNPENFAEIIGKIKKHNMVIGGEEYKRKKHCSIPELENFFQKKGISVCVSVTDKNEIFSSELTDHVIKTMKILQPLNVFFHKIVMETESEKKSLKENNDENFIVNAPQREFMW